MISKRKLLTAIVILVSIPLGSFALAAMLGLGDSSAVIMIGLLTFCCGFATCTGHSPQTQQPSLWQPSTLRPLIWLFPFPVAAWLSTLLLGSPLHPWLLLLWFAALFLGWYGAGSLLTRVGLSASARIFLLGSLNAAISSTPFWSNAFLGQASAEERLQFAQVLIEINPILTANEHFFELDLLTTPTIYLEQITRLSNYADTIPASSPWATISLAYALFLISLSIPKRPNTSSSQSP